ncbi:MAG: hypothetical protein AB7S80_18770 [Rhizobiaceae bacterium]
MDGNAAVERGREALKRILSALVSMAGLGARAAGEPDTLPRLRHRAILRLLRPAESAARRLIITLGMSMQVSRKKGWPACRPARAGQRAGLGRSALPARTIALPLFDRMRRTGPFRPRPSALPRITVPGWTERRPVRQKPAPDDPIGAARLMLRLDALGRALDDMPRHARRFARWQGRFASGQARDIHDAVPARNSRRGRRFRRTRRIWPLRMGGRPPGLPRRPTHEMHEILINAQALAWWALERRDTS